MITRTLIENSSFLGVQNMQAQKFAVEAIMIFVKNIKKALSSIFTLLVSQLYELQEFYQNVFLTCFILKRSNYKLIPGNSKILNKGIFAI